MYKVFNHNVITALPVIWLTVLIKEEEDKGVDNGDEHTGPERDPVIKAHTAEMLTTKVGLIVIISSHPPNPLCTTPVRGQEAESDGTADDFLHIWADDRQLHHQPQDDSRYLHAEEKKNTWEWV